jgi:hypothetical protein
MGSSWLPELRVHSSHQRSPIHGEAAPETVRMLKSRLLACSWSGPEQPNIVHCLRAGHWHRVTHRCPRNGAVGIRTSNLGSVELRTAGMHARTSFPRLLIPTVRDVPVVGYILRPPTYTIPAATGVYPQAEMPTPLQPFLIVQASSSALQQQSLQFKHFASAIVAGRGSILPSESSLHCSGQQTLELVHQGCLPT